MAIPSDKDREQRIDTLFVGADNASRVALRQALRDPVCWVESLAALLTCALKCVALTFFVASVARIGGADHTLSLGTGTMITMFLAPFNPWRVFWRNPFGERADKAFDEYLRSTRTNSWKELNHDRRSEQ